MPRIVDCSKNSNRLYHTVAELKKLEKDLKKYKIDKYTGKLKESKDGS